MKNSLILFTLLLILSSTSVFSQWKYENLKNLKQDVVINYTITYDKKPTDKQKTSSSYAREIVVILDQDHLLERKIGNGKSLGNFSLYNYKEEKYYQCYESSSSKNAISFDFKEPIIEGVLQEGEQKQIAGLKCDKYISLLKGKPVEVYTTRKMGLRYIKSYNIPGLLMQYRGYSKYLGFYTVKATKIQFLKLPKETYSIADYNVISNKEYQDRIKESKQKREKLLAESIGKKSPSFYARTIENKKISTKKMLENDIVVLNFWFTACGPCKSEIPKLNALKEQYQDSENVKFIAIGLDNKDAIEKFLIKYPLTYDIVDEGRWIASKFDITSYPTNIIIDKQGNIQFFEIGYKSSIKSMMTNKIDELLDE